MTKFDWLNCMWLNQSKLILWNEHIWIGLTDIATYGSVWLILPHLVQFKWYRNILVSLTDTATY